MRKNVYYLSAFFVCILLSCNDDYEDRNTVITSGTIIEEAFPEIEGESVILESGITLVKKNNTYVWEGDVLLTSEQVEKLNQSIPQTKSLAIYLAGEYRWPDGVVYYTFSDDIAYYTRQNVLEAMTAWKEKSYVALVGKEVIDFVERTTETDYVEIFNGDGNYSNIGRIGGKQSLSLSLTSNEGSAIHELGHTLGLLHEHCRTDRDDYVIIKWDNIVDEKENNFTKRTTEYSLVNVFDFNSIMMYPAYTTDTTFAIDIAKPIITKIDGSTFTAQRSYISESDSLIVYYNYFIGPYIYHW